METFLRTAFVRLCSKLRCSHSLSTSTVIPEFSLHSIWYLQQPQADFLLFLDQNHYSRLNLSPTQVLLYCLRDNAHLPQPNKALLCSESDATLLPKLSKMMHVLHFQSPTAERSHKRKIQSIAERLEEGCSLLLQMQEMEDDSMFNNWICAGSPNL